MTEICVNELSLKYIYDKKGAYIMSIFTKVRKVCAPSRHSARFLYPDIDPITFFGRKVGTLNSISVIFLQFEFHISGSRIALFWKNRSNWEHFFIIINDRNVQPA